MPDLATQSNIAAPVVAGAFSAIIGQIFSISALELMFAFSGAFVGLMFQEATPYTPSKYGAVLRFCKTVGILILVTISTAAILPIIFGATTSLAKTSMAFISGAILMILKDEVNGMRKVVVQGIKGWIQRWLGGFRK